ncbi:quinoprotein dehydrogenase-associated SoxYZ-like carrier [Methylocella sp.]|uniref:quinoprotein dehydrogenase-associated SoxYZ-like carrier n=1 Tax=Methylocella sp. TaxID=1978226 RepID=UPI00378304B3
MTGETAGARPGLATAVETARPASAVDPLGSPIWPDLARDHLANAPVVFDPAVEVLLPPVSEDQTQVPIAVDARRLGRVDEIVVIGELNPFPVTLRLRPGAGCAFAGFRMRVEQATPVRAAALKDGVWRVGGRYLDAAGGGCSAKPRVSSAVDWARIGEIRGRAWREADGFLRLRLRIVHPMDNGLHDEPLFILEKLSVEAAGRTLAEIELKEPVAANPTLTLLVEDVGADWLRVAARDTDGRGYGADLPVPARTALAGELR